MAATRVFRASDQDALVLGASLLHAALLAAALTFAATTPLGPLARVTLVLLLGLAMNWGSNTVSHIHLHAPLFSNARSNRAFGVYLSVLLAVPQSWWKLYHLEHHALLGSRSGSLARELRARGALELAALVAFVALLAAAAPLVLATVYAPAMLLGFALCAIQGREEHRRGADGVDVRARLYNRLWFNDGFHAAHHRTPEAHWTTLPARAAPGDVVSALPPIARWLDGLPAIVNRALAAFIDALERATMDVPAVRRFLVETHARAWADVLACTEARRIRDVTIIGGGLFPRTALVLRRLLPHARLTIVDAVPAHLGRARAFLEADGAEVDPDAVRFVEGVVAADAAARAADLVVVPLAFRGDRAAFYSTPSAPLVVVHDWLWRRRGRHGVRVSFLLLKRLNLVVTHDQEEPPRRRHADGPGHDPLLRQ